MKFRFVDSIASYVYAIFLVSIIGDLALNLPHHVIALEDFNDTSELTEAYLHNKPSITQYKQHISSSVPDPSSAGLKEDNGPVVKASTIESSSSSSPPITQDKPLPAAVLNQGTLSDQLVEPAAAVVSLAEEATSTLQQRAASQSLDAAPAVPEDSNTTGKPSPIDSALPSVILLPGSADPPPVVRALPKVIPPKEAPEPPPKEPKVATPPTVTPPTAQPDDVETTAAPPAPPPALEVPQEDIPSFSEWTQKQLEEAEKKKTENRTASPGSGSAKLRSKNYASPDCGAKVVATNPEAENPSGVLSSSRDDYLINTCTTTRQWIVIELCEAIQAKKLELANLELFSSSPKEFSVSLSRTFPIREWSSLGHFTAKDERTIQTFALQPLLFGKFIRVDFHSHYGNEHFCCTTLIRVYGTSEFEVLETEEEEDESHGPPSLSEDDEDEDYEEDEKVAKPGKPRSPKNLFGHATDAVFSIVKKAAAVLVKTSGVGSPAPQENAELPPQEEQKSAALCCTSPRHIVVCNNCSDETFYRVFELLSCDRDALTVLAGTSWIRSTLGYSRVCSDLGLDVLSGLPADDEPKTLEERWQFLRAMLSYEHIAAVCNVLAVEEHKVAVNMSQSNEPTYESVHQLPPASQLLDDLIAQTCSVEPSSSTTAVSESEPSLPVPKPDIRPTKTIKKEQSKVSVAPVDTKLDEPVEAHPATSASVAPTSTATPSVAKPTAPIPPHTLADKMQPSAINKVTESMGVPEPPVGAPAVVPVAEPPIKLDGPAMSPPPVPEPLPAVPPMSADSEESPSEEDQSGNDLDALLTEMNTLEQDDQTTNTPPMPRAAAQGQKESVFLRLSNKIKALDRNMSLSGQYLEELSRRYKKQEELGRALNKSLAVLWEETRRARSREQQAGNDLGSLREQVDTLSAAVDMLLAERNSWRHRLEHIIIILIEMSIFGLIFWTCRRLPSDTSASAASRKWSTGWKKVNGQATPKSHTGSRPSSKRRNSFDGRNSTPPPRKRRPSEEAINVTGSYRELVQQEQVSPRSDDPTSQEAGWMVVNRAESRRQQKKRRKNLLKSSSTHNLVNLGSSSPDASFYTPSRLTPTDEKDPQRRISVPAKIVLNARGESHSGPPWQGGAVETDPQWPVNVSSPMFMQTAASARSRRSVSSLASGVDPASARPPIAMAEEVPLETENLDLAYLPSQNNVSGVTYRTAGGSDSPRGSVSSGLTNFGNGESSKKTKKKGLKSMVKKLF